MCQQFDKKGYGCTEWTTWEDIRSRRETNTLWICEHIRIGSKWYQFGILLELDSKKLDDIHKLPEDSSYKTTKMFELWLDTNPCATRRQVIDALGKEVIEEVNVAQQYKQFCMMGPGE